MTFKRLKKIGADIWVAVHAKHYEFKKKYSAGSLFSIHTFIDPEGFYIAIKTREKREKCYLAPRTLKAFPIARDM